jgi:hypothetical protein
VEARGQGHFSAASPWGKLQPINLIRRMVGPHNRSGRGVRRKYIHVHWNRTPILGSSSPSPRHYTDWGTRHWSSCMAKDFIDVFEFILWWLQLRRLLSCYGYEEGTQFWLSKSLQMYWRSLQPTFLGSVYFKNLIRVIDLRYLTTLFQLQ